MGQGVNDFSGREEAKIHEERAQVLKSGSFWTCTKKYIYNKGVPETFISSIND